jgi:hypothetical protein
MRRWSGLNNRLFLLKKVKPQKLRLLRFFVSNIILYKGDEEMKKYYDEYEGLYEKAYEAMEMGEKMEGILHTLEGIGEVLLKLLACAEAGLAQEQEACKEKACDKEAPMFKIGVDLAEVKAQEDVIAKAFGNV